MNYEQLKAFTRPDRVGPALPWSEGDYSYASNGKILIRVPRLPDVPERETAPRKIEGEVLWEPVGCQWIPMPMAEEPKKEKCSQCNGGLHLCTCGNKHTCPSCSGSGMRSRDVVLAFCGKSVFQKDIALLCRLPGVEIPNMTIANDRCSVPFRFWDAGGKHGIGVVAIKREAINGE